MAPEEILRDEFASEDEKDQARKLMVLQNQAHEGALFEDWMRHQAGQKFTRYLDGEVADAKNKWLLAVDRESAEVVRVQAQVYQKIKQWIAGQILTGKVAAESIKTFQEEGAKLEGWIQNPTVRPE